MEDKRLYSPSYVKEILNRFGFKFSKSLGQNFLIDGNIVRKIVEESNITKDDNVLEIGPGMGTLTEELALKAKKVVAIEIDKTLLPVLDYTLKNYDNVSVVHGDVLELKLEELLKKHFGAEPVKVVANLPYYVTTPIIAKLIEDELNLTSITVMVQKEVAERMASTEGGKDYGSLSVFVNFYTEPEIVVRAPKTVFMPAPKIDSAVIRLKIKKDIPEIDKDKFFTIVKASFSKRRKTLLNCLSSFGLPMEKAYIKQTLESIGIDPGIRGEELSIEEFMKISEALEF